MSGDFPHIPEVDEYRNNTWGMSAARRDGIGSGGYVSFTPKILADAAVAALLARVAELEDDVKRLRHFNQLAIDLDATKTARIVELEAALADAIIERDLNYKTMVLYMEKKEQAEAERDEALGMFHSEFDIRSELEAELE